MVEIIVWGVFRGESTFWGFLDGIPALPAHFPEAELLSAWHLRGFFGASGSDDIRSRALDGVVHRGALAAYGKRNRHPN